MKLKWKSLYEINYLRAKSRGYSLIYINSTELRNTYFEVKSKLKLEILFVLQLGY